MSRILHPTLNRLFHIGLFDFYALIAVGVCTIVEVPSHILLILWELLGFTFILSALITLSGIFFAKLYKEFEAISIFILQAGLALLILNAVL
ncbi:hypothetical protein [Levilactobacillus tujiorum]|uniref:Manganese efflux pump MntP n=1 Tax=Levilactobacillus tujiorum TaxID=2912243 RepID=A0ABX1L789_9LACO|nr:hypothetical protein [Levilactobacillus tujiorum]MCH5465229.1 hypothetical protein [Levilactobacillus tujiorum]NLR12816.1 hypothetical protein [Lactobacillus sp. HBUAS51387]NLR30186.1 hypothetical protein [Levilactobacillus tujiorum]